MSKMVSAKDRTISLFTGETDDGLGLESRGGTAAQGREPETASRSGPPRLKWRRMESLGKWRAKGTDVSIHLASGWYRVFMGETWIGKYPTISEAVALAEHVWWRK